MPGILMSRKKMAALALLLAFACALALAGGIGLLDWRVALLACVLAGAAAALNEAVRKKSKAMSDPFGPRSEVRNLDCLIVGALCNASDFVSGGESFLQIAAPGRGLWASYEILRHTHSILRDGGRVVIAAEGRDDRGRFSVFDIPFLHETTVRKHSLQHLRVKSVLPIIFAPMRSLQMLRGGGANDGCFIDVEPEDEILSFCTERGYTLSCYERLRE